MGRRFGRETKPALGAAIAAAVGAGWYASFREAANAMTGIRKKIKPDSDNNKKYQELFPMYRRLYPCLKSATDRTDSGRQAGTTGKRAAKRMFQN